MDAFGVRFLVDDLGRFEALRSLFDELKHDKDAGRSRDPEDWVRLVPDDAKARFSWPSPEQRTDRLAIRESAPVAIRTPSEQLSRAWDFYRVFESIEHGDHALLRCGPTGEGTAEMRIEPRGYPYGGPGPFIALAEAFGFQVLGVNECGRYESRAELLSGRGEAKGLGETSRMLLAILATIAPLGACTGGPMLLARAAHPALGCVAAAGSAFLWTRLVRPMPGFIQGFISVWGLAAILGVFFVCFLPIFWRPNPHRPPIRPNPGLASGPAGGWRGVGAPGPCHPGICRALVAAAG